MLALQRRVDRGEQRQGEHEQQQAAEHRLRGLRQRGRQRHRDDTAEGIDVAVQVEQADRAEHQREQAGLQRVDQLLLGQQARQARPAGSACRTSGPAA
jgi:hypothetical protein